MPKSQLLMLAATCVLAVGLTGCGRSTGTRAVTGGLLGAGGGALIGGATGVGAGTGALIGGAAGAGTGAITARH